jgi:hypothetical protein
MNIIKSAARFARRFIKHEAGLVTVEWVAISAAVVVGGLAIAYAVLNGLDPATKTIGTTITSNQTLPTLPTLGNGS